MAKLDITTIPIKKELKYEHNWELYTQAIRNRTTVIAEGAEYTQVIPAIYMKSGKIRECSAHKDREGWIKRGINTYKGHEDVVIIHPDTIKQRLYNDAEERIVFDIMTQRRRWKAGEIKNIIKSVNKLDRHKLSIVKFIDKFKTIFKLF